MDTEIEGGYAYVDDEETCYDTSFITPAIENEEAVSTEEAPPVYSLENYISHYNIDPGISGERMTVEGIARSIGTNSKWVGREIERFGIQSELFHFDYSNEAQAIYPAYVTELIREQYVWRQHYLSLPLKLSSLQITEEVARSHHWTLTQLKNQGIKGSVARGHRFRTYPRIAVKKLREINFEIPLDDGWYTVKSLERITLQDDAWIIRQLSKRGLEFQLRRSSLTGMNARYYPPDALPVLEEMIAERKEIPPAGEWLTLKAIHNIVGKSPFWIQNNMPDEDADQARLMQDDNATTRTHYPPSTLENVLKIRDEYDALPEQGEWLTIPGILKVTGQERTWVVTRITSSGIEPELRRVIKANRAFLCYPPGILSYLQETIEARKPRAPEGWYTTFGLSKLVGRSENWVNYRLANYKDQSAVYEDEANVPRIHYPQSVLEAFQQEIAELEKYDSTEGWVTLKPLARLVGKHALWVTRVAAELDIVPEIRPDVKGHLREHYSPEHQQKLATYVLEHFTCPKADDWYTFSDIFHYVGRSKPWIQAQLDALNEKGEMRLDKVNTPRVHYNPKVAEKIKDMSELLNPGALLSVAQLSEATGLSNSVVSRRIQRLSITGEDRFSPKGKLIPHYPVETIQRLLHVN